MCTFASNKYIQNYCLWEPTSTWWLMILYNIMGVCIIPIVRVYICHEEEMHMPIGWFCLYDKNEFFIGLTHDHHICMSP